MASHNIEAADDAVPSNQDDGTQEGITVAIRMRPLNKVEGNRQRIWKVLPKYNSITQTTNTGKPLTERITGRTFFTFDKTFGEDVNTTQVYDSVAKGIVSSVVNGLNGTIFAYGQTSSGKTYTMQGSGSIEQGTSGEGGVVHMAAKDIFSLIESQQNRVFLVRASFLEIYNEEVRDLLSNTNQTLPIREDPRRGVFVQSVEEPVTDFESLLTILFHGEKSRAIASTGMNERSSRSHTIFRVTIESREKEADNDMEEENEENEPPATDGAVRVATLNLVDLAGSESVRHTGATGERQKEGGMINQSLLTLSRVIVSLGNSNQGHINFRDSKLTRILQPSLSGNARMAIVCCATPSELYLEETRSTLQFASRAKLVKTNAQVNEVLDDRSIIKRLQRELAEARRRSSVSGNTEHLRNLENQAEAAGTVAKEAREKLDRLKASILNTGYLFANKKNPNSASNQLVFVDRPTKVRKRRQSDGGLLLGMQYPVSPTSYQKPATPNTAIKKPKKAKITTQTLSPTSELVILREALSSKNESLRSSNQTATKSDSLLKSKDHELENIKTENKMLKEENLSTQMELSRQEEQTETLRANFEESLAAHEAALVEKDNRIIDSVAETQRERDEKEKVKLACQEIETDLKRLREQAEAEKVGAKTMQETLTTKLDEASGKNAELQTLLTHSLQENTEIKEKNTVLEGELETLKLTLARFEEAEQVWKDKLGHSCSDIDVLKNTLTDEKSTIQRLMNENKILQVQLDETKFMFSDVSKEVNSLREVSQEQEESLRRGKEELDREKKIFEAGLTAEKAKNHELLISNESLKAEVAKLEGSCNDLSTELQSVKEAAVAHQDQADKLMKEHDGLKKLSSSQEETVLSLKSELESLSAVQGDLEKENRDIEEECAEAKSKYQGLLHCNSALEEKIKKLESSLNHISTDLEFRDQSATDQQQKYHKLQEENDNLKQLYSSHEERVLSLESELDSLSSIKGNLEGEKKVLEESNESLKCQVRKLQSSLNESAIAQEEAYQKVKEEQERLKQICSSQDETVHSLQAELESFSSAQGELEQEKKALTNENESLKDQVEKLQSSLTEVSTDLQSAKESEVAQKEVHQKLKEEHESLKMLCRSQEATAFFLQSQMESLTSKKETMENDLSNTKQLLIEAQKEVEGLTMRVEKSESEANGATHKIKEMEEETELLWKEKESHEGLITELRTNLETSESDVSELSAKVEANEREQTNLKADKLGLEQRVLELENDIKAQKEKEDSLLSESTNSKESVHVLEAEVESLKSQLVVSTDKLGTLALEMESLREENTELNSRLSAVDEEKCRLEKELCVLASRKEELEKKVSDLQVELRDGESRLQGSLIENESLTADIARIQEQLSAMDTEKGDLMNQINAAEIETTTLREVKLSSEQTISSMHEQVIALETELIETQTREKQVAVEKLTAVSELQHMKQDFQGRLNELSGENDSLSLEKESLQDTNAQLAAAKHDLTSRLEVLEAKTLSLQSELENLTADLDTSVTARKALEADIELHKAKNANFSSVNDSLAEKYSGLEKQTENLEAKLREANKKVEELTVARDAIIQDTSVAYQELRSSLESAEKSIGALTGEKHELENKFGSAKTKVESLEGTTLHLETQLVEVQELLAKERQEKENITVELEQLREGMLSKCTEFSEERAALETKLREIEGTMADTEAERDELASTNEVLRLENQDTQNRLDNLVAEKLEIESNLVSLKRESMEARAKSDLMETSRGEWEERVRVYSAKLDATNQLIDQIKSERDDRIGKMQLQIDIAWKENEELESKVDELEEHARDLENQKVAVFEELESLRKENGDANRHLENIEIDKVEMEARAMAIQNESLAANAQADRLKATISEMQLTVDSLEDKLDRSMEENEEYKRQIDQARKDLEAATSGQAAKENQVAAITKTNAELAAKNVELKQDTESLHSENSDLRNRLNEVENDIEDFENSLESEKERSAALQANMEALEERYQSTQNLLEESQRKLDIVQLNLRHESSLRESLQKSLQEREAERDDATLALEKEYEKNRSLSRSISESLTKEKEAELLSEISTLKMNNAEVKQLLASCNESEQRFRKMAAASEKELSKKDAELEDALYRLSQMEEEISELSGVNESQLEESQRNLHLRIDNLVAEKTALEKQIENERDERETAVNELKRQMGEEQRLLIQEGEKVMGELRSRAETLEKRLQQSEAEAYAARQQIEELGDEKNSLQKVNAEANRIGTELRREIERKESQVSSLQSDLSKAKADSYAQQESAIEMKEKMRKASRECEKATREKEMASNELSTLRRKMNILERECAEKDEEKQRLVLQVQKAAEGASRNGEDRAAHRKELQLKDEEIKKNSEILSKMKQERNKLIAEIKKLHDASSKPAPEIEKALGEVEKLRNELAEKEKRIKKLESVRLTKEKVKEFRAIKDDNSNLIKQCAKFEEEIRTLQTQQVSYGSDSSLRDEISELRFHKEATETKLRKYVSHCQGLEQEKAGIMDTLRSCNRDLNEGFDISEAIISLCDKVSSRDARSIASDSDLQRLEKENKYSTAEIERLRRREEELSQKLTSYKQQVDSLKSRMKDVDEDVNEVQSELSQKIRHLEKENLQLHQDWKVTKKQLQSAKEELEMLRINAIETATSSTLDFGSVEMGNSKGESSENNDLESKRSEHSRSEGKALREKKGNSERKQSGDRSLSNRGGKRSREQVADNPSKKVAESSKPPKRQLLSRPAFGDNTNARNKENDENSRVGMLIPKSSKKSRHKPVPGLGEPASVGDDEQPECTQS